MGYPHAARSWPLLSIVLLGSLLGPLNRASGHGGQYRGPREILTFSPHTSPNLENEPSLTTWDFWWEFNRDRFLYRDCANLPEAVVRERILPVLLEVLEEEEGQRTRDEISAALIALARIRLDPKPAAERMRHFIPSSDMEISETAVLSLGILGDSDAVGVLGELLHDNESGREFLQRREVSARHQAMAAFSLGLIGSGAEGASTGELRGQIRTLLSERLDMVLTPVPDVHVACIIALGLLPGDEETVSTLAESVLLPIMTDKEQPKIGLIRAHVPTTLMRLARGLTPDSTSRGAWIDLFLAMLEDKKEHLFVRQSIVLALGELIPPGSPKLSAVIDRLAALTGGGQSGQERNFVAIALGQLGVPESIAFLRQELESGKKIPEPWAALGLALSGDASGSAVTDVMRQGRSPELKGAFAISLGLLRYRKAAQLLIEEFRNTNRWAYKGYLGLALGLMGYREAAAELRAAAAKSQRRPQQLQQLVLALGLLGDERIADDLMEMLRRARTTSVFAALAMALGVLGNERAIDPLANLARDREVTGEARAFALVALGLLGDRADLPWNAQIAENMNYRASSTILTCAAVGVLDML